MPTRSTVDYQAHLAKILEDIRTVVEDGQGLLETGASFAKDRAVAGKRAADSYLGEHPYQGIGISFGVGIVLGLLASSLVHRGSSGDENGAGDR